ncbi:hypothetical protein CAter10_2217 [Collimonas arenae]|nr:hypothetical protein [Collimonas arenae]AMO99908.1 hypothetical protein CAter10_2217 [Collimonas arenae]
MPSRFAISVVLFLLGVLHAYIGWRLIPALPACRLRNGYSASGCCFRCH